MKFVKSVVSRLWYEKMLQFHLLCLNWCWHSSSASCIPAPTSLITSGLFLHNFFWALDSPGMLSQNIPDPNSWNWSLLKNLQEKYFVQYLVTGTLIIKLNIFLFIAILCLYLPLLLYSASTYSYTYSILILYLLLYIHYHTYPYYSTLPILRLILTLYLLLY